jgi:hypothetical protein
MCKFAHLRLVLESFLQAMHGGFHVFLQLHVAVDLQRKKPVETIHNRKKRKKRNKTKETKRKP